MEEWLKVGQPQMQEILDRDPEFQSLLSELERTEAEYYQVLQKLTQEDQQIVERYIGLCEELDYQKLHTAYKCGRMRG
jgi:hypothetical protein